MKYTVETSTGMIPDCTARAATATAKKEAKTDSHVFVSFYRASDGQHGYLNRDGNHAITGKAW